MGQGQRRMGSAGYPHISRATIYVGVDPGTANTGLTASRLENGVLQVIKSASYSHPCKREDYKFPPRLMANAHEMMVDIVCAMSTWELSSAVFFIEDWRGGKNPHTIRWRGFLDGALYHQLHTMRVPAYPIDPNIHKRMLHPDGKAADNGRKSEAEYLMHLGMLDRIIDPDGLKKIANPEIPANKRTWKDARQHSLDAAAIMAAGFLSLYVSPDTLSCGFNETAGQGQAAYDVAKTLKFV